MKLAGKYPNRIRTTSANPGIGLDATDVFQGGVRSWSYDPAEGATDYQYDTATSAYTRWVHNRGQGTSVAAFRFAPGDVAFGGVTWNSAWPGNGESRGSSNGISIFFSWPGNAWSQQFNDALPPVEAFRGFCYGGENHRIDMTGLVVGKSYVVQAVFADSRAGAVRRTHRRACPAVRHLSARHFNQATVCLRWREPVSRDLHAVRGQRDGHLVQA